MAGTSATSAPGLSHAPSRTTWLQCLTAAFVPLTKQMAHQSSAHMSCPLPVPPVTSQQECNITGKKYTSLCHQLGRFWPRQQGKWPRGKLHQPGRRLLVITLWPLTLYCQQHSFICFICSIVIEPYYTLDTVLQTQWRKTRSAIEDQINSFFQ